MVSPEVRVALLAVVAVVVAGGVLAMVATRGRRLGERLLALARSFDWSEPRITRWLFVAVRGSWRQYPAGIRFVARQKAVPPRIAVTLTLRGPARVVITRRGRTLFGGRPLAFFGPPVVELRDGSGGEFWIRTDELSLAERLLGDPQVMPLLRRNLLTRFDTVQLQTNSLRVVRSADVHTLPFDEAAKELFDRTVREAWELETSIVEALSLMP